MLRPTRRRNSTPHSPTAPPCRSDTSSRCDTSTLSTTGSIPRGSPSEDDAQILPRFLLRLSGTKMALRPNVGAKRWRALLSDDLLRRLRFGERLDEHPLDDRPPLVLPDHGAVGQQPPASDVGVLRLCEPVERVDGADHDAVITGAHEPADPVAGPAAVGEDPRGRPASRRAGTGIPRSRDPSSSPPSVPGRSPRCPAAKAGAGRGRGRIGRALPGRPGSAVPRRHRAPPLSMAMGQRVWHHAAEGTRVGVTDMCLTTVFVGQSCTTAREYDERHPARQVHRISWRRWSARPRRRGSRSAGRPATRPRRSARRAPRCRP